MHGILRDGTLFKREKEKDKLRMAGGAWSLNLEELDLTKMHRVTFVTEKARYSIDAEKAMLHGFERLLGGELKLVVPLRHWEVQDVTTGKA